MGQKRISHGILVCFIKPLHKIFSAILALSLVSKAIFGVILMLSLVTPVQANAGLFSSLVGDNAYAQSAPSVSNDNIQQNSQTLSLLQANVSPASILQEPKAKPATPGASKTTSTEGAIDPNATVNIVSDNAILPATGPLGVSDGKDAVDPATLDTSVYVVRKGDSVAQIAEMFGVSVNTVLWANDIKKGEKLSEGDILLIPPISGLEITVAKGQTLQSIAKQYKADINDIIQYNDISLDAPLAVGDTLMIPDAQKSEEGDKPVQNLGASIAKSNDYYKKHPITNFAGYFVNPVPGYRLSQGIHDDNAVDLAIPKGTPIHAAAAGKVIFAKTGYNGGFGYLVIIAHPNGTQTYYAHQSKIATTVGAQVAQGQVIGYVGSTGHSTGPHLHFAVKNGRNPGADGSWAN